MDVDADRELEEAGIALTGTDCLGFQVGEDAFVLADGSVRFIPAEVQRTRDGHDKLSARRSQPSSSR